MTATQEVFTTDRLNNPLNQKRNYGIDLLRIVAMLMIITLHVLKHGGIIDNLNTISWKYEVAWGLELFCYIGVNIYALISGYACLYSKYRPYKIITLWFQVQFFNLISAAALLFIGDTELLSKSEQVFITPALSNQYWYFTAYIGLFVFIPLLNKAILSLDKKTTEKIIVFSMIIFFIYLSFDYQNAFRFERGYSTIFLMLLYIIGGYLRKYDLLKCIDKKFALFVFATNNVVLILMQNVTHYLKLDVDDETCAIFFNSYNNIFYVISAICLLAFFSNLELKGKRSISLIKFFAPLTFGIYIIHLTPIFWSYLTNAAGFLLKGRAYVMLGGIILFVIAIFMLCALLDYARLLLFRLLKVERLSIWIYTKTVKLYKGFKAHLFSKQRI